MREAHFCYREPMIARRIIFSTTRRARALRTSATDTERLIWRLLCRYRPKFTRQLPIGPYIADFACRQARLVVEIDGAQHADCAQDIARTDFLKAEGWQVIRFWNSEVRQDPEAVVHSILLRAAECLGGAHPQPLPSREGRVRRRRFDAVS